MLLANMHMRWMPEPPLGGQISRPDLSETLTFDATKARVNDCAVDRVARLDGCDFECERSDAAGALFLIMLQVC
jgi:hypothetical protein